MENRVFSGRITPGHIYVVNTVSQLPVVIPRQFLYDKQFKNLSTAAFRLYAHLLDVYFYNITTIEKNRALSSEYTDEEGRVYVKQSIRSIAKQLHTNTDTILRAIDQLQKFGMLNHPPGTSIYYITNITTKSC